jgi:Protein of unknown function (DUF2961)
MRPGFALLLLCACGCGESERGPVSVSSIVDEMTDLDHLARLPAQRFITREASSYARTSVAPDQPGWFANHDKGQFIRDEFTQGRHEWVMMDADGPGAIVRIWSATPQGTIRIYLDGAPQPALSMKMTVLLDGEDPRFPQPLAHVTARGHNLYYPIPFAKHCKVTVDETVNLYYQIHYRVYAAGTPVETFNWEHAAAAAPKLARVARELEDPPQPGGGPRHLVLVPGQPITIRAPGPGGGVIRELVANAAGRNDDQLRATVLVMRADGEETIRAPIDVLFGSGAGLNTLHSLPFDVERDATLRSRWPMPFRGNAELELASGAPLELDVRVDRWQFGDDSMYFHARWHAPDDIPTQTPIDWNMITVEGEGQYVGNTWNGHYYTHSWWGEGDEKVWVDGDTFPSWFGTGMEDYYGYAWCSTQKFSTAYHAQTRADGRLTVHMGQVDGFGRTSLSRFHVIDPIPFSQKLRFDFEVLDWPHNSHLAVDAVAYYYARPGSHDNLRPLTAADQKLP